MLLRRPKLLLIGMLPAVLTTAVLLGGMIALTLFVGGPFYEHIAERLENDLGVLGLAQPA